MGLFVDLGRMGNIKNKIGDRNHPEIIQKLNGLFQRQKIAELQGTFCKAHGKLVKPVMSCSKNYQPIKNKNIKISNHPKIQSKMKNKHYNNNIQHHLTPYVPGQIL